MRFFAFLTGLLAFAFGMAAEIPSPQINGFGDSRVRIEFDYVAKEGAGSGVVTYQDGAFIYDCSPLKVYNDTRSMWTINEVSREAVAEIGSSEDLFANPRRLVQMFGFNPKGAVIEQTTDAAGMLSGFNVTLKNGKTLSVVFTKVKMTPKGPLSDFSCDSSLIPAGFVLTDLR